MFQQPILNDIDDISNSDTINISFYKNSPIKVMYSDVSHLQLNNDRNHVENVDKNKVKHNNASDHIKLGTKTVNIRKETFEKILDSAAFDMFGDDSSTITKESTIQFTKPKSIQNDIIKVRKPFNLPRNNDNQGLINVIKQSMPQILENNDRFKKDNKQSSIHPNSNDITQNNNINIVTEKTVIESPDMSTNNSIKADVVNRPVESLTIPITTEIREHQSISIESSQIDDSTIPLEESKTLATTSENKSNLFTLLSINQDSFDLYNHLSIDELKHSVIQKVSYLYLIALIILYLCICYIIASRVCEQRNI